MFEKLKNFFRKLFAPIVDSVATLVSVTVAGFTLVIMILAMIVALISEPIGAAIAAILVTIVGVIITMITSTISLLLQLFSKVPDSVAKIYDWTWKILRNLETLFGVLNATEKFNESVKPEEAKTVWRSFTDKVETLLFGPEEKVKQEMGDFKNKLAKRMRQIIEQIEKQTADLKSKYLEVNGKEKEKQDGSKYDVAYASWEAPAETPAVEDPVITRLDNLANQLSEMNSSLQTKDEKTPAGDELTEIKDALQRIENALGLNDIAAALDEIRLGLQSIIQTGGEENAGTPTGDKLDVIEAKLANNETKLEEKTNDLGVEVRDSKHSVLGEIAAVKSRLEDLIEDIVKKAMTFDQIYNKFGQRLEREVRDSRGRR